MVNMGELFAFPRLRNAPMDRVPLTDEEAQKSLLQDGDLLFARQSLVLEGAGKC
jgi:type I restriction enzyme S subunit